MIELLVTLAVTTIGMVGLVALNLATMNGNSLAARNVEANAIAQDSLEQIRSMPPTAMLTTYGTPLGTPVPMDSIAGRAGTTYDRAVTIDEMSVSSALLRIRIEVSWRDDGSTAALADHKVALELLRPREEPL